MVFGAMHRWTPIALYVHIEFGWGVPRQMLTDELGEVICGEAAPTQAETQCGVPPHSITPRLEHGKQCTGVVRLGVQILSSRERN